MNALFKKRRMSRFVVLNAIILTALMMFGCGGGGGGSSTDSGGGSTGGGGTPPTGSPEIALSSSSIAFGNLVATKQADRSVTVQNTGTAGLVIGQIAQASPVSPAFSIDDDGCSGTTLAANGSCTVIVRFAPAAQGDFLATFNIPSNDADEPSLTVSVTGTGQGLNVTINKVDTSGVLANGGPVKVLVSVTDASDVPILGLLQTNFTLSEAGASPTISAFSNTVTSPISAILVLDYSESLVVTKDQVQAAAKNFLDQLAPTDEVAVVKFAGEVTPFADFTLLDPTGLAALKAAIDQDYTPADGTKLYDAVYFAVNELAFRDPTKRRTAIVLSDGVDFLPPSGGQLSTNNLEDVIDIGQDNKVFIYTIGLGQDLNIGAVTMGRMADETGGEFIVSPTEADLNNVYLKVSQILSNQYELTFTTARPVGTSNSLKVAVDTTVLQGDNTVTVTY